MDFLRPQFESSIEPLVQGDVVQVGRFGYTGADILKLAGEDAYKQAFGDWVWDEWVPTRRERKDELLKLDSNEGRFNELKKMIASSRAIPFVGSGMSAPTGLPTWGTFLRETCKRTKGFKVAELECCLAAGNFDEAASRIFGAMPSQLFHERFESSFMIKPTQPIDGPVRLLPFLFDSIVITTNFDGILEDVYKDHGKAFQAILHGLDVGDVRKRTVVGSRCLLKLHGNYNASHGRVLLKDEYDAFYEAGCSGREELALVFRRGGMVFLGCSLAQDRTMALLKEVADADKNMPRHYSLLQRPKAAKKVVEREHFLTERNIFPIWYDGDHSTDVEALLVGLMEELEKL
ncbi:SIR2 family protein [Accumulibacter sp.]|uniref:SIR2 family NAD-dependent protein deacylase n=1 Tax=Accumulibacter sp. TaxID=2053492 RepID=UPI002C0CC9A1|nr:SIR2 family protein [Accumulibacter sp.]HRF05241.1 SIR2 family protein [Accumulibacter sp.]